MTALLAACGKDLAAAGGFHACAEAMRFGAASFARLVCALWQNNSPLRHGRTAANIVTTFANPLVQCAGRKRTTNRGGGWIELSSVFEA
jgi:hypothetical protein